MYLISLPDSKIISKMSESRHISKVFPEAVSFKHSILLVLVSLIWFLLKRDWNSFLKASFPWQVQSLLCVFFQAQQFWRFLIPCWSTCASVLTLSWVTDAVQREVPLSAQAPRRVMRGLSRMLLFKQLVSNDSNFSPFLNEMVLKQLESKRNNGKCGISDCTCYISGSFYKFDFWKTVLLIVSWADSQEPQWKLKILVELQ